jgi:hypothetical protein
MTLLPISPLASAESISIVPIRDNTLYQNANGGLSDGMGKYLFAGVTGQNRIRRGLIHFDVASNVPSDAMINSVELTLYASRVANNAVQTVSLHRTLSDWGEGSSNADGQEGKGAPATPGDATWLHSFYNSTFWTTTGGDYAPAASGASPISRIGSYSWSSTPQLVADVQSWLDNPTSNFGWTVVGNESAISTSKRFDSREADATERRPRLTIDFTRKSTQLAGDFSQNGSVDAADYVVWRKGLKTTYALIDYDVWRAHFGQTIVESPLPAAVPLLPAVPEPSTLTILLMWLWLLALDATRPYDQRVGTSLRQVASDAPHRNAQTDTSRCTVFTFPHADRCGGPRFFPYARRRIFARR